MRVNQANSTPQQCVLLDEEENLMIVRPRHARQRLHQRQYLFPVLEIPTGDFAENKRVDKDLFFLKEAA
jgi:hypothetical protein